jgi:hypothetical protein
MKFSQGSPKDKTNKTINMTVEQLGIETSMIKTKITKP